MISAHEACQLSIESSLEKAFHHSSPCGPVCIYHGMASNSSSSGSNALRASRIIGATANVTTARVDSTPTLLVKTAHTWAFSQGICSTRMCTAPHAVGRDPR